MKQLILPALICLLASAPAAANNAEALVAAKCTSCHGDEIYTRANRRVQNLHQLEKQLYRCTHATGIDWDNKTVSSVMNYLNSRYYKFKE